MSMRLSSSVSRSFRRPSISLHAASSIAWSQIDENKDKIGKNFVKKGNGRQTDSSYGGLLVCLHTGLLSIQQYGCYCRSADHLGDCSVVKCNQGDQGISIFAKSCTSYLLIAYHDACLHQCARLRAKLFTTRLRNILKSNKESWFCGVLAALISFSQLAVKVTSEETIFFRMSLPVLVTSDQCTISYK